MGAFFCINLLSIVVFFFEKNEWAFLTKTISHNIVHNNNDSTFFPTSFIHTIEIEMEPSYKKAKYLSAESSPNYLCIDLRLFSLQQLNFLAKQVEEQIRRYTTLQLKDQEETTNAQQKNVETTNDEWIDIWNWEKDEIKSEINILAVWIQRGN